MGSGDKDSHPPAAGRVGILSEGNQIGLHGLSFPATSGTWKKEAVSWIWPGLGSHPDRRRQAEGAGGEQR